MTRLRVVGRPGSSRLVRGEPRCSGDEYSTDVVAELVLRPGRYQFQLFGGDRYPRVPSRLVPNGQWLCDRVAYSRSKGRRPPTRWPLSSSRQRLRELSV